VVTGILASTWLGLKEIWTDFINAIERLLLKGHKIAPYVIDSKRKWIDVDSLDRLEVAKRIFRVGEGGGITNFELRITNYE